MQHDVTLSGHGITLVPLSPWHAHALHGFIDSELWAGMAAPQPGSVEDLADLFATRLADPGSIGFAVTHEPTGQALGTTSLTDYSHAQQRTDIGGTFFGRQFWGTPANRASKNLLLAYAFDVLDVDRVGFRCDARNTRSATAISRLGASYEGTLRSHRLAPDGSRSDTAVFSILRNEWPSVRNGLLERLATAEWPAEQPAPQGWAA